MKKHKWYYTTGNKMNAPSGSAFFDTGNTTTQQQSSGSETTSTSQGNQNVISPVIPTPITLKTPVPSGLNVTSVGNNSTQPVTDNTTLYLIVGALAVLYFLKGN